MHDWSVFDYLPDAILVTEAGGKVFYANQPAEALFGYGQAELVGTSIEVLFPNDARGRHKNGHEFVLEAHRSPVTDSDAVIFRLRGAEHTPRHGFVRREAHLAAVVEVQRMLLASEGRDLPLNEICGILGSVFHVSRVYMVENTYNVDERMVQQRQFEWCAANIQPCKNNPALQHLYYEDVMPNWRRQLSQGKMVAGVLADFSSKERRFLITQGIQAILIFPLLVSGRFAGFLAFDDCLVPRQWQPSEISLLQVVTTSIAMVRERLET